ncbi:MAG: hypothetical protein Q7K65_03715 [Candidatus Buchananbacteria bacterium]|nr:hypothetical protein [Candidatus Buchananbacteria bacterium]
MGRSSIDGFDQGLHVVVDVIDVHLHQLNRTSPVLLAIAGGSCSGKSLLAQKLAEIMARLSIETSVLNFDDYYKDIDYPAFPFDDHSRAIFDLPQSYLLDEFNRDVKRLLSGESIASPVYDKKTNKRLSGATRPVIARPVVITEGLFVISAMGDISEAIKIFITADDEVRIARRIKRDTGVLHDSPEDTLLFIVERVEPYYEKYVAPQMEQADLVILNND